MLVVLRLVVGLLTVLKNLKDQEDDDDQLSPMQKKELDQLKTTIFPSFFSPDLAAALKGLQRKEKQ